MSSLSLTHAKLIVEWFDRSQKTEQGRFNIFDQFISLWFAFNAWMSNQTNQTIDRRMLDVIEVDPSLLIPKHRHLMQSNLGYRQDVTSLAAYGVKDESGERPPLKINDTNSFHDVLEVIYRVRCNLFHGKKSIRDEHDRELVGLSYSILDKLFVDIVEEIRSTN